MWLLPKEGLQIDGFTLGPRLHRGGFATIWQVSHPDHDVPMVMKVPFLLAGKDGPTVVSFEVEQLITRALSGPHVPRVIAQGGFDPMPYIVTEQLPGMSMDKRIKSAPLPIVEVIDLARGMAEALHALHSQGVIHLDVKPANFLRRTSGEMVLIDFGLSRYHRIADLLAAEFAIPIGSYPYFAPEQYLRQRSDLRSDIYALGILMYQMATGTLPFGRPIRLAGVGRRLWQDPIPPRMLRPDIPEWLQEIILRALELQPNDRFGSAALMAFELANPAQVRLTERGMRVTRETWVKRQLLWWQRRNLLRLPQN